MVTPAILFSKIGRRCRSAMAAVDRRLVHMPPNNASGGGGSGGGVARQLYSAVSFQRFRRELLSVFAGRRRYYHYNEDEGGNAWLLRRNTHRIEKALCMRPLRDEFAAGYIVETVEAYRQLLNAAEPSASSNQELMHWAHDVLDLYFDKTEESDSALIANGRSMFRALADPRADRESAPRVPYCRDLSVPAPVAVEDLLALAKRRRSVRWFEQKAVPRELIDKAIEVAAYAPTACNRQAFELRIFDSPEMVEKVARIPMGTTGYHDNIPVIGVLVGRMDAFFDERDRHLIYIDGSLFAMGLVYALESQGLSSCCINWPDIEEKETEMAALLDLEAWQRPVMLIAMGYPDPQGMVPYSQKKPLDSIRRYEDQV